MLRQQILRTIANCSKPAIIRTIPCVHNNFIRTLVHANDPDIMKEHKKAVWHREGADHEPLPLPDVDDRRTDSESDYDDIENAEINEILADEYVEPEIHGKFRAYMNIVRVAEPMRFMNRDVLIHPTLKKLTYAFFEEAQFPEHYTAMIEASSRCQEIDFLLDIIDKSAARGYTVTEDDLLNIVKIATYRRSHEIFNIFLERMGEDRSKWSKKSYLAVAGFYEMMLEPKKADEIFAEAVAKKVTYPPWRPIYRSHFFARRAAQTFATRHPMWDEQPPISDVVQLDGMPNLQARVALRYALYSMQGLINTDVHKPIRVPHNLVVQVVRRKRRGAGKNELKAHQWAPTKHQLMEYLAKFGVKTGQISDAGNLFYIEKETFDKLPNPSNIQ